MSGDLATWFNSWDRIFSVIASSLFFFVFVIALVRLFGKRTTSQMNNYDWIITFAIGSLVGSGILLKNVSVADASTAIVVLSLLQWILTFVTSRSETLAQAVQSAPTLLVHKGEWIEKGRESARITKSEIRSRLRQQGYTSIDEANWVILENDGNLTVIPRQDTTLDDADSMEDVPTDDLNLNQPNRD